MPLTYTDPGSGISNQLPDSSLSSLSDAVSLSAQLGLPWVDMVKFYFPQATVTTGGETRGWYGIFINGVPVDVADILSKQQPQPGAWQRDSAGKVLLNAGGFPVWAPTPPPQVPSVPPPSIPNVIPGINSVQVDYPNNSLNRALALFLAAQGFAPK